MRVQIAREAYQGADASRTIFLSLHADITPNAPAAPLVLYYEGRRGRNRDNASRRFAQAMLPALGADAHTRGQSLGVLRNNPAGVKALVEVGNLFHVEDAWALRYEQLRHRNAEKVVRGVLDYAGGRRLARR
jgi:N-acetylmuramoyl-L-alanine amidase